MARPIERVTMFKISGKEDRETVLAEIREMKRTAVKVSDCVHSSLDHPTDCCVGWQALHPDLRGRPRSVSFRGERDGV